MLAINRTKLVPSFVLSLYALGMVACKDDDNNLETTTSGGTAQTSAATTNNGTAQTGASTTNSGSSTNQGNTNPESKTFPVNPALFLPDGLVSAITEEACTLSDGTSIQCYKITVHSRPTDHQQGPWCPTNVADTAQAGGIWPENGIAHDVDGAFVANLATFYNDPTWKMANDDGSINYTETAEECEAAARPDVDPALQNHCVQCLPSYLDSAASYSYLIPKTPVRAASAQNIRGNMGLAFNGVEFAMAAPTGAILGAYTLAPFDDCGGHINLQAGYHYHAVTSNCLTKVDQSDGHAAMIGYAMDGFPMHEMNNQDGNEPVDLDACRGHEDDQRGYHYHVSGAGENMIIGCWSGLTPGDSGQGGGPGGGGPGGGGPGGGGPGGELRAATEAFERKLHDVPR